MSSLKLPQGASTFWPMLFASLLCLLTAQSHAASAATANTTSAFTAPTAEEVMRHTRPFIRSRLRLPESLHQVSVPLIQPAADDPAAFEVRVRFHARSPFGATTQHELRYRLKRAQQGDVWIVTAD